MHGWQSEPTDGSKGGWGMLRLWVSYSLSLSPARLFPIVSIGSICLFLSACLFVHPFLWWSMAFSVYLGLSLSLFHSFPIYPSINNRCILLSFYLSIYLSVTHFTVPSIDPAIRYPFFFYLYMLRDSARPLHFLNVTPSKTKQFCETSVENGKSSVTLTASYQRFLPLFHSMCLKYCTCHEYIHENRSYRKCCACHPKSS